MTHQMTSSGTRGLPLWIIFIFMLVPCTLALERLDRPKLGAPWSAIFNKSKPYSNYHRDFEGLVRLQAGGGQWVTLMMYTAGMRAINLNCIYSLVTFGEVDSIVIGVITDEALEDCSTYHMPCADVRPLIEQAWKSRAIPSGEESSSMFRFGSDHHVTISWMRFFMLRTVLNMGYTGHVTDGDITYFRPVIPSYEGVFKKTGADMVGSTEYSNPGAGAFEDEHILKDRHNYMINVGNLVLRSTPRTRRMVEKWLLGRDMVSDQKMFNRMAYVDWAPCEAKAACYAAAHADIVPLVRSPALHGPRSRGMCAVDSWDHIEGGPCSRHLLFYHVVCVKNKYVPYKNLDLWVLDNESMQPLVQHAFLPCSSKPEPAWNDWPWLD